LSSYADAIAVAGARGYLGLHRPDGELIADVVTLEGRDIHRIVWTPDRTQLYVSSTATGSSDGCSKTVAIDLATKEVAALGNWSDVAFSSDGKKLAAFVEGDDCGVGSLLIRVVATRAETTVKSGERAEWDGLGSLNWVPGSDSVVFVQHGLGDSSAVRLLDPAKHDALDEAATLDPVTEGGGELVTSVTYAGNRMLIGTQCCLGATEYVRILERNRSTGRVTQLLRNDGNTLGIGSLEASPDGDQVIFSSFGDNASVWLWDMSGSSAPRTIVEGTAAAGW
jgi:WD40 repeat protein